MRQWVTAFFPVLDENGQQVKDKYGRPLTEAKTSKARVQFRSQVVYDAQGRERRVNLEIDMPPTFNPPVGTKVEYMMVDGRKAEGTIQAKDEAMNLSGSKVYYRTVYVDG